MNPPSSFDPTSSAVTMPAETAATPIAFQIRSGEVTPFVKRAMIAPNAIGGALAPVGSQFRFHCDEMLAGGGLGSAPDPLDYLAVGIGFCFMTQLGRDAHIKKHRLGSYRITQIADFAPPAMVETHVFLDSDEPDDVAADIVRTGEKTCILHAARRNRLGPMLRAELNGAPLEW